MNVEADSPYLFHWSGVYRDSACKEGFPCCYLVHWDSMSLTFKNWSDTPEKKLNQWFHLSNQLETCMLILITSRSAGVTVTVAISPQGCAMLNLVCVCLKPQDRPTLTAMWPWENLWLFLLAGIWFWSIWLVQQQEQVHSAVCLTHWPITASAASWSTT